MTPEGPSGSSSQENIEHGELREPTGCIVKSTTDKIVVGPPCLIWFPYELVDLVNAHSLVAEKVLQDIVNVYHPSTRLFLNSYGNPIHVINCAHLKSYIGLPITAYDFRRSLATYCLSNTNPQIRNAESSILRHNEYIGFAYYFSKHSNNVEYVNSHYANQHNLIRANMGDIDKYTAKLKETANNMDWELQQKRQDACLEVRKEALQRKQQACSIQKVKGKRTFILQEEYQCLIAALEKAKEEEEMRVGGKGSFAQLLKYFPDSSIGGIFPPNSIWTRDFTRLLFGLEGPEGDALRQADLTVYDGIPFSKLSGRQKIKSAKDHTSGQFNQYSVVSNYWREKIRNQSRLTKKNHWDQLKFLFNSKDYEYYKMKLN